MSKTLFIGLGVAVFVCLYAVGWHFFRPRIERDLLVRTLKALEGTSVRVKAAKFFGRDGDLHVVRSGAGPDGKQISQTAEKVFGVRAVRVVAEESKTVVPWLVVERVGETVTLTGRLPEGDVAARLFEQARSALGGMQLQNRLESASDVQNREYLSEIGSMAALLARTAPEGRMELRETTLTFSGEVPDQGAKEALESDVRKAAPQGLTVSIALKAAVQKVVASTSVKPWELRKEFESVRFEFGFNSTSLTSETLYLVEPTVELIRQAPHVRFQILGHADSKGSDSYNQRLSKRRADSIAKLFARNGVPKASMKAVAMGESNPIADNETEEGRQKNRRVEFRVIDNDLVKSQ